MLVFDRLDAGTALHFVADDQGDMARLAGDPDPELLLVTVTALALVDMDAAGLNARQPIAQAAPLEPIQTVLKSEESVVIRYGGE